MSNIHSIHCIEIETASDKKLLAEKLGRILHRQLVKHIRTKISDPSKNNHPALLFFCININYFATLIFFYNQDRWIPVTNNNIRLL